MEKVDLDTIELSAREASLATGVQYRTVVSWLDNGLVEGRQEINLRRYTTVGALRQFLATRGLAGQRAIAGLEEYATRYLEVLMPDHTRSDGAETHHRLIETLRALQSQAKNPTARELAAASGESHTNVRHHLHALQTAGMVTIREVPSRIVRREIVLVADCSDITQTPVDGIQPIQAAP